MAVAYPLRVTTEEVVAVLATVALVDLPQAVMGGEEEKDRDTVQDLTGFSWEEDLEAAATAAAVEGVLAWVAAATVLARAAVADPSYTSLQSFGPPLRRQSRRPCRASQPSPQRQWRCVWWQTSGEEASPPSYERTSVTSVSSRGTRTSPPYGER